MLPNSLKTVLLRSTMLVGATAFALPAFAQVTPGTPAAGNATPGAVAEAAPNPEGEREITVTGSLIKNPNLVRATPVIVTTSEEIELRQSNVAEDVLREIPGVVPSIGSAVNNGNGGASFVDLRGIGPNRNLVLLDGNRIVPSGLGGVVDLNNIPLALIDRVESLTGAASTTYGADAIAGVVNFITKKNFTGVDISGSEQITEKGDGNYYRTDATIGGNFADDKGNAVLSVGYQHSDPVYQGDRSFSVLNISSFSGNAGGSGTYVPSGFTGTRNIDPRTGQPSVIPAFSGFDPVTGLPIANPLGTANPAKRQINPATGQAVASYAPYNFNPYNIFQTPFKRFNIFAQANYEASEHFDFYTRALFSKNTVDTIIAPSGVFGSSVTIPLSNPYLPAALRNQFCALNVAPLTQSPVLDPTTGKPVASAQTTYVPYLTPAQCAAAATATSPTIVNAAGQTVTNPAFQTVTTLVSRRTPETGPRISDFVTTVFDYKAGVRGKISDHLDYDIYGSYGESENLQSIQGYVLTSRVRAAAYATNTTTCLSGAPNGASTTPGCVPVNLFGANGSITPAQAAYLVATSTTRVKTQLGQVHAQVSGDFGITSPAATDPISFAVGAEYRKYLASQSADTLAQTAGELGGAGGAAPNINGGYHVVEGFGELIIPLVQDKPGIESLTADGGVRYSHYEVDAPGNPSYNTTTYKGELAYSPGFGLKLRGNYAHAVRAPSIGELFTPVTTGLTNLSSDPCASFTSLGKAKGTTPTGNLAAVCLAQGATAGNLANIFDPTAGQANLTSGGNVNVKPETADTFGGGVVFSPKFFSGFSTSVDYYHIRVVGAISSFTPGDIINGCFGNITAASATSTACQSIRRNPSTGGLDGDPGTTLGLITSLSNFGRIETEGVDVTFNYSRDIHFAKLGLSFLGNYTAHNRFQASPVSLNRDCVGYYSVNCASIQPKFQWSQRTTLSFDSFDVSLLWRHIDKERQEPDDVLNGNGPAFSGVSPVDGTTVNYGYIKPYDYFDLSGRISVVENLSLTLTVQNIGNRKPPPTGTNIGSTSFNSGNTYPSTYDALGRRYAVTARVKF